MYGPNVAILLMYESYDIRHRFSVDSRWSMRPSGNGVSQIMFLHYHYISLTKILKSYNVVLLQRL